MCLQIKCRFVSHIAKLLNSVKGIYIKIRNTAILLNNKRRSLIRIETKGKKIPYFLVSEKYESLVKWSLRILTGIGIATSILTLRWHYALALSFFLCLIERLLETLAFQVTTIYVQPIPEEWDNDQWLAMISYQVRNARHVGMLIKTKEQAEKLYECIKAWNYGQYEDTENNIRLSFVIEKNNSYTTFLYPSPERSSIKKFKENIDYEMFTKKELKEHQQIVVSITFCKPFPYQPNSGIIEFISGYKPGMPFAFGIYYTKTSLSEMEESKSFRISAANGNVRLVGEKPFVKYQVLIKQVDELIKEDYEYHYRRLVMSK